tara:strand:- start:595 stop:882 length:288 start_codon:yes stop_codon:yes gene_type:complete
MKTTSDKLNLITESILSELLKGGQIISSSFGNQKGYILIKRITPIQEENSDRKFYFAMYVYDKYAAVQKFYLATEYIKMTDTQCRKLAMKSFYNN